MISPISLNLFNQIMILLVISPSETSYLPKRNVFHPLFSHWRCFSKVRSIILPIVSCTGAVESPVILSTRALSLSESVALALPHRSAVVCSPWVVCTAVCLESSSVEVSLPLPAFSVVFTDDDGVSGDGTDGAVRGVLIERAECGRTVSSTSPVSPCIWLSHVLHRHSYPRQASRATCTVALDLCPSPLVLSHLHDAARVVCHSMT